VHWVPLLGGGSWRGRRSGAQKLAGRERVVAEGVMRPWPVPRSSLVA
jgi:hypothetical protein